MENLPITPSKKILDFQPRSTWPAVLPSLSWQGIVFAGTDANSPAEMSQKVSTFAEALVAAYPKLGLGEIARLISSIEMLNHELKLDISDLLTRYGLRDSENLRQTLQLLLSAPPKFVEWIDDRGVGVRDLAPLRAMKDRAAIEQLMTFIGGANPNKNLGVQALEWAIDLFLMGHAEVLDIAISSREFQDWHSRLRDQRFSQRTQKRAIVEKEIFMLALPKDAVAHVAERGDRLGMELKIFAENSDDLARKLRHIFGAKN